MATRVAIMSDGKLRQVGTPREIYDYPNSRFTAEFIGETNIIAGEVIEDAADYCIIASKELSRPVRLGHGITGPEDQDIWVSLYRRCESEPQQSQRRTSTGKKVKSKKSLFIWAVCRLPCGLAQRQNHQVYGCFFALVLLQMKNRRLGMKRCMSAGVTTCLVPLTR